MFLLHTLLTCISTAFYLSKNWQVAELLQMQVIRCILYQIYPVCFSPTSVIFGLLETGFVTVSESYKVSLKNFLACNWSKHLSLENIFFCIVKKMCK